MQKITDEVFTVDGFLAPEECDDFIRQSESTGYSNAPITTSRGPVLRPQIRNNSRVMVDDNSLADRLWRLVSSEALVALRSEVQMPFPNKSRWEPAGLNERFRFYRYTQGQQFDWHYDGPYERPNGEASWVTLLVYLNDDFEGGETRFEDCVVKPEKGMALFFVHQIHHKGEKIASGRKYVLRTDVMYELKKN